MAGFDIGTFQSKAAYADQSGKPQPVPNARGEYATPSALHFHDVANPLIGKDAIEQGFVDPQRFVGSFKLKLGTTDNLLNNGLIVTATDAAKKLIQRLKEDTERAIGADVKRAVATCPANFLDDAKQALLEAYAYNDILVDLMLPEPTAAGLAYYLDKQNARIFIVFDFGGGTFDVSAMRTDNSQVLVLATEGVPRLGGSDFNEKLTARVLDEVERSFHVRPTPQAEPLFFHDLYQRVEQAKLSLGNRKQVPIVAALNGSQVVVQVTQDEFHRAIEPLVQQTLDATDKAIAAAGLEKSQINDIVMVGGTSRMPYVQEAVARHLGMAPKTDIDPEKAIAFGAAIAFLAEMGKRGETPYFKGKVIPTPDVFVRDVTAHAVGCCVLDKSGPARRLFNYVMVPKNTVVPCQRIDSFFLEDAGQTAVRIEILQGEPEADRDKCLLVGEIMMDNLPSEATSTQRLQIEYVIDANGMVTVTATDKISGRQKIVSVDYKKGLKPKDNPKSV